MFCEGLCCLLLVLNVGFVELLFAPAFDLFMSYVDFIRYFC